MTLRTTKNAAAVKPSRMCRKTYDIFDTLIARRCIHGHAIFALAETRSGVVGFAKARGQAERQIEAESYSLSDIYRKLGPLLRLGADSIQQLMELEVLIELENVIPIAEHLDDLPHDAILVTDMYLPVDVIREMLRIAGLCRDVPILIHSHGKSSGAVWRELAQIGVQCVHLGDNEQSDIVNAREAGMRARLTSTSRPTAVETMLQSVGAPGFAMSMRAARLCVRRDGMPDWLYRLQTELNIPFLLICAIDLFGKANAEGVDEVLFASRDGRNLQSAFDAVRDKFVGASMRSRYWYTSRCARTGKSASYLEYCRSIFSERPLIADLCGTGASTTALLRDLGGLDRIPLVYVGQKVDNADYADKIADLYELGSRAEIVNALHTFSTSGFLSNAPLEELNYVPEGMVRDVQLLSYGALPFRDDIDFDGESLELIRQQYQFVTGFFRALSTEGSSHDFQELVGALPALFDWLHEQAPRMGADLELLRTHVGIDDFSNEVITMQQLGR